VKRRDDGGMKVLFATAELSPVASVGGLAQAAAGLVAELRRQDVDIEVVMPDYGGVELADETVTHVVDVPLWAQPASVRSGIHPVVGRLHLVDVPGMAKPHPYVYSDGTGWWDNDARFLGFSMVIAALARAWEPDVLHLNDWHTAAALADLPASLPSVLSIHNLAYQGTAAPEWFGRIGPRGGRYERYGTTNPLSGGLLLADAIVAVSPSYAAEILHPANGYGLDSVLRHRADALVGILNGIDTELWDPATDSHLVKRAPSMPPAARAANRAAILERVGWQEAAGPLLVMVTRLVEQKGVDLVLPSLPLLHRLPARLVVLGSGDAWLAGELHRAARAHPDTVAFVEGYDERLSHLLVGGGDLLLMPSRFEPCGLAQMQALRYGTLPVVTGVGGLLDTVIDLDAQPETGTGFVADRVDPVDILDAVHRAVRGWSSTKVRRAAQLRGMARDWSWREPALAHLELYGRIAAARPSTTAPSRRTSTKGPARTRR
jgi:starch synthase